VVQFEARLMSGCATVRLSPAGLAILRAVQPAAAARAQATQRPAAGAPPGWIEAELPTEPEPSAARQLLRLGTEVEVLAPASLRAAVAGEAAAVARRHRRELR
jgi:predicted DNA-binding transcriptional regulator YafY